MFCERDRMSISSTSAEPFHEIIDFFRCDAEISKATPAEEFANFLNYDKDWVTAVKPVVEYQGFDTDSIMSQLVKNRDSYLARKPDEVKFELKGKDGTLFYSNLGKLEPEITILVIAGLTRNSKINQLIAKAREPGKELFTMLKEKYDIKDDDTSLESSVLTLPKIARVYPAICAYLFDKKAMKEIVPYDTFPGSTKPETHAICCPLLQSCCPFTLKAKNNFHPVMLWVQIKLDDIIHRHDGNTTSLSQILSYYWAAYQSKAKPEASRIRFFLQLGIIIQEETSSGQNWKLIDSAVQLAANCLSELDNMRRDDEKHAALMKLARTGEF